MADGSLPASGSVSPKHPMTSPAAMPGSHRCLCSSEPKAWIAYIASEPCTDTRLRSPLSTASNSWHTNPYAVAVDPPQPYHVRCMPSRPSLPNSTASSRTGTSPVSNQSAM